jgi:hypothetical protein
MRSNGITESESLCQSHNLFSESGRFETSFPFSVSSDVTGTNEKSRSNAFSGTKGLSETDWKSENNIFVETNGMNETDELSWESSVFESEPAAFDESYIFDFEIKQFHQTSSHLDSDRFTPSSVFDIVTNCENMLTESSRFDETAGFHGIVEFKQTSLTETLNLTGTGFYSATYGANARTDIFVGTNRFDQTCERGQNSTAIFEGTEVFNITVEFDVSATFPGLSEAVIAAVTSSVSGVAVSTTAALAVTNKFCSNKALKIAEDIDLPDVGGNDGEINGGKEEQSEEGGDEENDKEKKEDELDNNDNFDGNNNEDGRSKLYLGSVDGEGNGSGKGEAGGWERQALDLDEREQDLNEGNEVDPPKPEAVLRPKPPSKPPVFVEMHSLVAKYWRALKFRAV